MNTRHSALTVASLVAISLLAACGKKDDAAPAAAPSLASAQDPGVLAKAAEAQRAASLPKADLATPTSAYLSIDSGKQLLDLFYAVSGMPPDMDQIANSLSQDYRATQDNFKRQDILKVLTPRIKTDIAAAGQHRYVIWEADNNLIEHYDFEHKRFPVKPAFWKGESNFYYNDNSQYKISFKGVEKLQYLPVADEAIAREIEALVDKYQALRLRLYAFAQDADLNNKTVKSQTLKLELLDNRGRLLASVSL